MGKVISTGFESLDEDAERAVLLLPLPLILGVLLNAADEGIEGMMHLPALLLLLLGMVL